MLADFKVRLFSTANGEPSRSKSRSRRDHLQGASTSRSSWRAIGRSMKRHFIGTGFQ